MKELENNWVLVSEPGTDFQEVVEAFPTMLSAYAAKSQLQQSHINYDVMKLKDDGTLTTEF